jgi:hypothetical protein
MKNALMGRVTNTEKSPRAISMARRKFSSKRDPSTKPSRIGGGEARRDEARRQGTRTQ